MDRIADGVHAAERVEQVVARARRRLDRRDGGGGDPAPRVGQGGRPEHVDLPVGPRHPVAGQGAEHVRGATAPVRHDDRTVGPQHEIAGLVDAGVEVDDRPAAGGERRIGRPGRGEPGQEQVARRLLHRHPVFAEHDDAVTRLDDEGCGSVRARRQVVHGQTVSVEARIRDTGVRQRHERRPGRPESDESDDPTVGKDADVDRVGVHVEGDHVGAIAVEGRIGGAVLQQPGKPEAVAAGEPGDHDATVQLHEHPEPRSSADASEYRRVAMPSPANVGSSWPSAISRTTPASRTESGATGPTPAITMRPSGCSATAWGRSPTAPSWTVVVPSSAKVRSRVPSASRRGSSSRCRRRSFRRRRCARRAAPRRRTPGWS